MLPSNQRQLIEQVKFTYSQFGKASEKQNGLNNKEENR